MHPPLTAEGSGQLLDALEHAAGRQSLERVDQPTGCAERPARGQEQFTVGRRPTEPLGGRPTPGSDARCQYLARPPPKTDTPPGPTSSPATIRTMPSINWPWTSCTMPTTTRMAAIIHKTVAFMVHSCPRIGRANPFPWEACDADRTGDVASGATL